MWFYWLLSSHWNNRRVSHRTHHQNHGHVEKDESWHPVRLSFPQPKAICLNIWTTVVGWSVNREWKRNRLLVHCIWHVEKLLVVMTDFRVYLQRYGLLGEDRASVLSLGHVSISILPGWSSSTLVPLDPFREIMLVKYGMRYCRAWNPKFHLRFPHLLVILQAIKPS
jgi:hypothetical protein